MNLSSDVFRAAAAEMILAAPPPSDGSGGATTFLNSSAGTMIKAVCGAVALILVIVAVFKAVQGVMRGRPAESAKVVVGCLFVAAILFNLQLTIELIQQFGKILGAMIDSLGDLTGGKAGG
ncbi:hypothetical protein [Bailinhaonella thermotolerans]|uniref:Uncharacterized protein n=1 Tax=Bailinhaonella thermotolerans TaxID=1070861 RepID=A0A3A4A7V7_9ACTN|nr:hypothetical protein [Bailinhaonella thermotolerans]RJL24019.1 hypothetical protein D5H75_31835 [Bailinhaonella thermotolerans]